MGVWRVLWRSHLRAGGDDGEGGCNSEVGGGTKKAEGEEEEVASIYITTHGIFIMIFGTMA